MMRRISNRRCVAWALLITLLVSWVPSSVFAVDVVPDTSCESVQAVACDDAVLLSAEVTLADTSTYYYNQLNAFEQKLFHKMESATWDAPSFEIALTETYDDETINWMVGRALSALVCDRPEFHMLWKRYGSWSTDPHRQTLYVSLEKTECTEYMIQKALARADQIAAEVGGNDLYTKVRSLLTIMAWEMSYDPYYPFIDNVKVYYNDSVIGPMLYNNGVCGGFSDTFKLLCNRLDIPCISVGNAGHAWNYVQMEDGKWYAVDTSASANCSESGNSIYEIVDSLEQYTLWGEHSDRQSDPNYHIGEMYLGCISDVFGPDFEFPELAEEAYAYKKQFTLAYKSVGLNFEEPSPVFRYCVNEDGLSCTITGYEGLQKGDLVIPDRIDGYTVTAIGDAAFYYCTGFDGRLYIPNTVVSIGSDAFQRCNNLSGALKLPNSLVSIESGAFLECRSLSGQFVFPDGLQTIGAAAFYDDTGIVGGVELPDSLTSIGQSAFSNCSGLTGEIYLPDGLVWDSGCTFNSSLQSIRVNETNEQYASKDGILYTKDGKTLLYCPPGKSGSLTIPEGTETIGASAFCTCRSLRGDLVIPGTVTTIEEFAFRECGFDGKLIIPDSVKSIGGLAFFKCGFSGNLVIPNSVEIIEQGAFMDIPFGGTLALSNRLTKIEPYTFTCSKFVGDLVIPDSVTRIENEAFSGCYFGGTLYLPDSLEYIGTRALAGDDSHYNTMRFSNAINLTGRGIVLEKDAFQWTRFPGFFCDCSSGTTIIDIYNACSADGIKGKVCNHCGGTTVVTFTDANPGAYYAPAVNWAVANNITAGTTPTTFSPDETCTRAQVVAFLWRAAGRPAPETTHNPFTDVKSDDYFYEAVLWASENGIVYGTSSSTFSPNQGCTRAQVAAFLWRAEGTPEPTTGKNPFTDVKASEYYAKAVIWAAENKIVYGTSTTQFSPEQSCTRAQIVTFLFRTYGK